MKNPSQAQPHDETKTHDPGWHTRSPGLVLLEEHHTNRLGHAGSVRSVKIQLTFNQ